MLIALVSTAAGLACATVPQVDVYTMGPGAALFERFGHAAICTVCESEPRKTRCYNYGTTDFDTPPHELGWRFVRGGAVFWVSVWDRGRMLRSYTRSGRKIWRQRLPLSPDQAREVAAKLQVDALEENRHYAYHHFYDNCTTRVRDIVDRATGNALSRGSQSRLPVSYRELARERLRDQTGLLLASDFLVGRGADRHPTRYEAMFLPSVMREAIAERLGVPPEPVNAPPDLGLPAGRSGRGWMLAVAALLGAPLAGARRWPRWRRAARRIAGGALGFLGLVVWAVALVSTVPELRTNEALLLFVPADLCLIWSGLRWRQVYVRVRLVMVAALSALVAIGVLLQPLLHLVPVAALPLLLILLEKRVSGPIRRTELAWESTSA